MNYYEHHLGDYAKDTGHLSMLEHGAYRILLDRYYSTEAGIPEDQVYRLARARTDAERAAVDAVLAEFFTRISGVWINRRAEAELDRLAAAQAETDVRDANERERVRRHREDRARLFADLRRVDIHPEWNIKTRDLRALHARHCNGDGRQPVTEPATAPVTLQADFGNVADTASTPSLHDSMTPTCCVVPPLPPRTADEDGVATRRGELARLLRDGGVDITPGHPALCQWVTAGLTDAEAREAVDRARLSKPAPERIPAGYLSAIVPKVLGDRAAAQRPLPRASPTRSPGGRKSVEQQNREAAARARTLLFGAAGSRVIEGEVIRG